MTFAAAPGCRAKGPEAASSATSGDRRGSPAAATAGAKARGASRTPCDLLTKAEVEEILETTVRTPVRRGGACHFLPDGKPARGVSVTAMWTDGKAAMQGARLGERLIGGMGGDPKTQEAMKKMFGGTEDLQGLGDEASFQIVTLHVRKGDAYISIDARLCSRAHAIALARKAVARL